MANIQCKMCGGVNEIQDGVTSGVCQYCGSLTTFPKFSDEQTEHLYSRAEHFRQKNDFDKAVSTYESILNRNSEDPEAYWGLVISRYGIEYVEDPATHERIPTCHRVQYESILADSDYQNALKYASGSDRDIYEIEANRIAEIQKGILRISAQEKPYDVFICYKETTEGGTRTKDSTLAQDIYYQLTNQGLKVFFSRITLEDKLGQQYEPYIFAALNSAKVMLVIGSKKEYFEAVWVKNEWSRFLALMKKDRSKLLIPCYRDMDAYDIPEELSMFQSQDMSKIGLIQDILRGIMKVVNAGKQAAQSAASSAASPSGAVAESAKLMKRISVLLEQQDW
ncbi:MAG: toll/interleukin-1 receptor domain-containing protein, partial [Lentisphaeria bacterium]|nr:toll/interleukin-1 receptor domain-containing protein [Lentisphaeria bacterium]